MSVAEALALDPAQLAARALAPVDVAVVDSGVDATHPDLAGRVVQAMRIEDATPLPQDVPINNDAFGHGTAVAAIIARIAPNARIIDIRVLRPDNKGTPEDLVAGLRAAVRARHPVVNMSLAAPARVVPRLVTLCERAFYQDQVIVAARRNMPLGDEGFPAEFASCIGVGNAGPQMQAALRYRPGHPIDYDAPGEAVVVPAAGGGYTTVTGTSFAAPAVSGVCALLLGAFPTLHPFEVRAVLASYGAR
jgi:subtilisin family serine protease